MSGVLVIAEVRRGELREVSLELLTLGAELSQAGAGPLQALVVSDQPAGPAEALNVPGVEAVLTVTSPLPEFEAHLQAHAVSEAIAALAPTVVLAGHTVDSMGFAAAVAAQLELGFATDATSVSLVEGRPRAQRGSYRGRFLATVDFPDAKRCSCSCGPAATSPRRRRLAAVRDAGIAVDGSLARTEHVGFVDADTGDVDITQADFLLAIGRGVDDEADVETMMELADSIGATWWHRDRWSTPAGCRRRARSDNPAEPSSRRSTWRSGSPGRSST